MRLPFIQKTQEACGRARMLVPLLGITRREALGLLDDLWFWALELGPETEPPSGELNSPRAAVMLAGALEWSGDPSTLLQALVDVGLVARTDTGVRVRGLDRYKKAWEKAQAERDRKAKWRETRTNRGQDADVPGTTPGQDGDIRRKKEMKTQTQIDTEIDIDPLPPAVVGGGVESPDSKLSRLNATAEAGTLAAGDAWEFFQEIRSVNDVDRERRSPKDFATWWVGVSRHRGRIFQAFRKYLSDPDFQAKGWPLAVFMSPNIYEARL